MQSLFEVNLQAALEKIDLGVGVIPSSFLITQLQANTLDLNSQELTLHSKMIAFANKNQLFCSFRSFYHHLASSERSYLHQLDYTSNRLLPALILKWCQRVDLLILATKYTDIGMGRASIKSLEHQLDLLRAESDLTSGERCLMLEIFSFLKAQPKINLPGITNVDYQSLYVSIGDFYHYIRKQKQQNYELRQIDIHSSRRFSSLLRLWCQSWQFDQDLEWLNTKLEKLRSTDHNRGEHVLILECFSFIKKYASAYNPNQKNSSNVRSLAYAEFYQFLTWQNKRILKFEFTNPDSRFLAFAREWFTRSRPEACISIPKLRSLLGNVVLKAYKYGSRCKEDSALAACCYGFILYYRKKSSGASHLPFTQFCQFLLELEQLDLLSSVMQSPVSPMRKIMKIWQESSDATTRHGVGPFYRDIWSHIMLFLGQNDLNSLMASSPYLYHLGRQHLRLRALIDELRGLIPVNNGNDNIEIRDLKSAIGAKSATQHRSFFRNEKFVKDYEQYCDFILPGLSVGVITFAIFGSVCPWSLLAPLAMILGYSTSVGFYGLARSLSRHPVEPIDNYNLSSFLKLDNQRITTLQQIQFVTSLSVKYILTRTVATSNSSNNLIEYLLNQNISVPSKVNQIYNFSNSRDLGGINPNNGKRMFLAVKKCAENIELEQLGRPSISLF